MELQQVNTLKLNAKKINSVLIRGNNNVKKLKADEKNLLLKISDQNKKAEEERKVESKGGTNFPGKGLLGKVAQPVMSVFDKLKEFFGSILLGILIEDLPKAIAAAQKFFDDNPWIIPTVKNIFKFLGKTLMGMIDLVNFIKPGVIFAFEKTRDAVIGALNLFGIETDALLGNDIKSAEDAANSLDDGSSNTPVADPEPVAEGPESQQSNPTIPASGITPASSTLQPPSPGPEAVKSSASTPDSSTQASKSGSQTPNSGLESGPKKGFKYGGMFIPSQYSKMTTNRRGRKISGRRTQIVQETGTQRKAREALSSYGTFFENMQIASNLNDKQTENNESFEKFLENYRKTDDIFYGDENDPRNPRRTPRRTRGTRVNIGSIGKPVNVGTEVIGFLGSTGNSTGPHIHIEQVGVPYGEMYTIPDSVKQGVLIDGVDMITALHGPEDGNDGIGWHQWRNNGRGRHHHGEDFGGVGGEAISLKDGFKFIKYEANVGGYGNRVFIQAPNGDVYTLSHLQSGPRNPAKIRELTNQQHRTRPGSGGGDWNVRGEGDRSMMLRHQMESGRVVYIIQPMVKRARDTIVLKHIDRLVPVTRTSFNIPRPNLG